MIKYIETRVSGNTLHIKTKDGVNLNDGHFKVYITAAEIRKINGSGAANIDFKSILKNEDKITRKPLVQLLLTAKWMLQK